MMLRTCCLAARASSPLHDQTFLGGTTGRRWKLFRPFVQDDWRVTDNLTVNLGWRGHWYPNTEVQNRQANFNFQTLQVVLCQEDSPALADCTICVHTDGRAGIQFDKTAIEPRIGLAWKPLGSDKTVSPRRLRNFPRLLLEPGRQGSVAESAVLC